MRREPELGVHGRSSGDEATNSGRGRRFHGGRSGVRRDLRDSVCSCDNTGGAAGPPKEDVLSPNPGTSGHGLMGAEGLSSGCRV